MGPVTVVSKMGGKHGTTRGSSVDKNTLCHIIMDETSVCSHRAFAHVRLCLEQACLKKRSIKFLLNPVLFCFSDPPQQDAHVSDAPPATLRTRAGQERKTRKSAAPTLMKKTVLDYSSRASRIENSSARLLVGARGAPSAAVGSNRKDKDSLLSNSGSVTQMDIDEPLHTPPPPVDSLITQEPNSTSISELASVRFEKGPAPFAEETLALNVDKKQAQGSNEEPATTSSSITGQPQTLSSVEVQVNNPMVTAKIPRTSHSTTDGNTSSGPSASAAVTLTAASSSAPSASTVIPGSSPTSASCGPLPATAASPTLIPLSFSCAPVSSSHTLSTIPSTPNNAAGPGNVVSLKIIVSDNEDEDSSGDTALNRAISSITGEKIPTIYLSSPAKSPGCPATPKANFDEAAQAVSSLQSSEIYGSPLSYKAAAVCTTPLTGTGQTPQRYIIQLPVDHTSSGLQGSAASYFLVTPTADVQARQVLLPAGVSSGQPLPLTQPGVTPTHSQNYATGKMDKHDHNG